MKLLHLIARSSEYKNVQSFLYKFNYFTCCDFSIKECLSRNLNLSEDLQIILARDSSFISCNLAANASISEKVQMILFESNNSTVKLMLSYNPNICENIQLILAKDEIAYIRNIIAGCSNISNNVQLILAKDDDHDVKHTLYKNPSVSRSTRLTIFKNSPLKTVKNLLIDFCFPTKGFLS